MAPAKDHDVLESQLKDVIQDLYQIMVQTIGYDTLGPNHQTKDILVKEINRLQTSLQKVHLTSTTPNVLPKIPPEIIHQYVDAGRNPDIYTREAVEYARKGNQIMKGKVDAFRGFRDVLAEAMGSAMPEVMEDVERVLEETGGRREKKES
ncbi:mediator complex, subunit Med10 [Calycina marina]|uniref:Mediator of RNA polymerase II transcription subunit 10 n=1 Tax=Calycina marina TaxID=1763456 RepID=A0A9P7Z8C3_9HELO|nr:mediator complex, subunit Med10 [Calycina marina]